MTGNVSSRSPPQCLVSHYFAALWYIVGVAFVTLTDAIVDNLLCSVFH